MMPRLPIVVFAPSPLLTVTIERSAGTGPEIHLHGGGQGFWVARMAALLGADVTLCCALGGEPGTVLRALIARERIDVRSVDASGWNGVYVHDRRGGERRELARTAGRPLTRHEADELYGITFSAGLDARAVLLTGCDPERILDSDLYRRLAADLRSNGVTVIADLTGSALEAALRGGLDLLKISHDDLIAEGLASSGGEAAVLAAMPGLHAAGAAALLVSRAEDPALALDGEAGRVLRLTGPRVHAIEPRGAGDSMFAALGAALADRRDMVWAMRLAMAAGCLNATRHGLGTGTAQEIRQLSEHVLVEELPGPAARASPAPAHGARPGDAELGRGSEGPVESAAPVLWGSADGAGGGGA